MRCELKNWFIGRGLPAQYPQFFPLADLVFFVLKFLILPAGLDALQDMVIDATVAAQHHRCHQTRQFLFLGTERAIPKRHAIQIKEPFYPQMVDFRDAVVHAGAIDLEFVETVGHVCRR